MLANPFDEDPNDPSTWPGYRETPAPWEVQQSPQLPSWLASAQQYVPQAIGGLTAGLMQLPGVMGFGSSGQPEQGVPLGPAESNPEDDLKNLRMYRARQQYEQRFGSPGPWGSAASVTSSPDELLARVRKARSGGWRPGES
jgi:hypothetical protein